MTKRSRSQRRARIILYLISVVVALSMVCSWFAMVRPQRQSTPTPTTTPTRVLRLPTPTAKPTSTATATTEPTLTPSPTPLPSETPTEAPTLEATPIAVSDETDFVFAVCGDNRDGNEVYRKIMDMVVQDGCAFLINTGDLVSRGYERNFQDFAEQMRDFPLPFFPVPGNHDVSTDGTMAAYLEYSGAPARHYSFDYGLLHFSMVDSSLGELMRWEMTWLDADLSATRQPVKIVVLHYPPFDPAGTTHIMRHGNDEFMALMARQGVKYVFSGHIHSYDLAERDGVTYIITGGAGAPLYPEDNREAFYHYVRVTVHGEKIETEVVKVPE